jgi:hypothetical protein
MPLSQGNFGNMVGFEMREVEIGKLGGSGAGTELTR